MTQLIQRRTVLAGFAASTALATLAAPRIAQAEATTHTVQMLNKHPDDPKKRQVFYPRVIVVQPGDTVLFEATDRSHNSESIKDMIPDGAEAWKGKINEEVSVTFDTPGFYGYRCTPHSTVGMVGMVVVQGEGMMDNMEAAQDVRQRGKAKAAFAEIWEEIEGMDLTTS